MIKYLYIKLLYILIFIVFLLIPLFVAYITFMTLLLPWFIFFTLLAGSVFLWISPILVMAYKVSLTLLFDDILKSLTLEKNLEQKNDLNLPESDKKDILSSAFNKVSDKKAPLIEKVDEKDMNKTGYQSVDEPVLEVSEDTDVEDK